MDRSRRTRIMSTKGQEMYELNVSDYKKKLDTAINKFDIFIGSTGLSKDVETVTLKDYRHKVSLLYHNYETIYSDFKSYLERCCTEDSNIELYALSIKTNGIRTKFEKFIEELDSIHSAQLQLQVGINAGNTALDEPKEVEMNEVKSVKSSNTGTRSRVSSRLSAATEISSVIIRKQAKAEAAKAKMVFHQEEAKLRKKKTILEEQKSISAAAAARHQTEIDIELELLKDKKEVSAAEAEIRMLESAIRNVENNNGVLNTIPLEDPVVRTANFVNSQQENQEVANSQGRVHVVHQQTETTDLINFTDSGNVTDTVNSRKVDATNITKTLGEHEPSNDRKRSHCNTVQPDFVDFTKFLLRKELTLSRLSNFNDKCENYSSWKCTFVDVTKELGISPAEEIDLLIKWLGFESKQSAISLKIAHPGDPVRGLAKIWERLDERYGAAESVHHSVLAKLERFPRLGIKDTAKLYDLCDILGEIEALKTNPVYSVVFSYFDSSVGIAPIVSKLPYNIQEKWATFASRYKKANHTSFPPLSVFAEFVRDQAKIKNDPGFHFGIQERKHLAGSTGGGKDIVTRKTDVKKSEPVKISCPIHRSGGHTLGSCRSFKSESFDQKRTLLKENKLCFRCFSPEHMLKKCNSNLRCSVCQSVSHHTLLHVNSLRQNGGERSNRDSVSEPVASNCTQICESKFGGKSCGKIVLVYMYSLCRPEHKVRVNAILDEQSNRTLAKPELFSLLDVSGQRFEYTLKTCSGSVAASGRRATDCIIESLDGRISYSLPTDIECTHIPDNRDEIPVPRVATFHPHLADIAPDIPELDESANILLLIGRDLLDVHHVLDQRLGPPGTPYAQRLNLGWVVIGETCLSSTHVSDTIYVNKTFVLANGRAPLCEPCTSNIRIVENLKTDIGSDVFLKTSSDEVVGLSVEDREFLGIMDKHMWKSPSGHWSVPLPFRDPHPTLPNNRQQVWDRAKRLDVSLKRNPEKMDHFLDFMKGVIDSGHAELAPSDRNSEHWYLPIFGVYHPKKPGQIRGVFDASARYNDISLNDVLLSGPDLTNNLLGILLRFRKDAVAVTADIERMFYCFLVDECHRNYLRFFWYKDNDPTKELTEYRMCVHVFGNKPSPAVATYGLRRSVENSSPDVKEFVNDNFYVDDGLISLPSSVDAVDLVARTQQDLKSNGQLRLHKITSNSTEVMNSFPNADLAKDLRELDILVEDLPLQRSLGLQWQLKPDCFVFHVCPDGKPFTRRGVLSVISSVYDPLGLVAPVIVSGKLILKDLIQETSDWDKPLPVSKQGKWERWRDSLDSLKHLEIPRMYLPISLSLTQKIQLYVYSDASEKCIAAVAYIVSLQGGVWHKGFVLGKAKVAPKSGHTIPRLELCAAVLAVEIYEIIRKNLAVKFDNVFFFTDSRVVLGYIQNRTRRFYKYVSNRVEKIHRSTDPSQWSYVRTDLNPADSATRSMHASEMKYSPWLHGPSSLPPIEPCPVNVTFPLVEPEEDKEIRPVVCVLSTSITANNMLGSHRFEKFSSWSKLVSAVSLLLHVTQSFRKDSKCKGWHICLKSKSVDCRSLAEGVVIRSVQAETFSNEISSLNSGMTLSKDSPLIALNPVLDKANVLRVGGRLRKASITTNEKNPVIVPKKFHLAILLVRHYHALVAHQGRHITEGAVRSAGFWIIGCKRLVSSIISKCVRCKKIRGSTEIQKMADLPTDRLTPSPPFSFVGFDTFGPWEVLARRTRGGLANNKRWAIMFTCLTTRAVHIEVIESMNSSSFINAMRRLIALRGPVLQFRSDRGTNFVGASNELSADIEVINVEDKSVQKFLTNKSCVWLFNPPLASHMGGVWERMIGVTRRILNGILLDISTKHLSHEVLCTLMAEVSAIINGRPLVAVSSDPDCPEILTPAALVTQKTSPPVNLQYYPVDPRTQWKYVQALADTFWKRWRVEYIQTLQVRQKWQTDRPNLKAGDVVLLRDKEKCRNDWPLGVVSKVLPSDDQKVRKVEVRISNQGKCQTYVRPISDVVWLLSGE